jgi:NUBPL iron-transfer P-loop NTPase
MSAKKSTFAKRLVSWFKQGIPVIGVVENMSGFLCPKCTITTPIFAPSSGGAEKMCKDADVPFLGSIPIDPRIAKSCDLGESMLEMYPESPASLAYMRIIEQIKAYVTYLGFVEELVGRFDLVVTCPLKA